jgi:hypothetical protein
MLDNPDERIWQIFDKFTILRTYSEYAKELNKIKAQWPIMQKHPLVLEMMIHTENQIEQHEPPKNRSELR